jgi:uncharacterized protein YfaS (alpha-2-macroglobulin family)
MKKGASHPGNQLAKLLVASVFLLCGFLYFSFHHDTAKAEPSVLIGKGSSYFREWARVDSLSALGLYKSALDLTNQIYTRAKTENNNEQIVKALIHRFKFSDTFQENSEEFAMYDLRNELKTAKYPLAPVLHSMLGDLYWQYYERNRWQFAQRSQTVSFKNDSINTWSLAELTNNAVREYNLSLEQSDLLKKEVVGVYDAVIEKGDAAANLRPTLYDFLAHRAIDYFSGEEPSITRPADQFVLDNLAYFGKAQQFVQLNLKTNDTLSFKFYALQELQQLIAFRLTDKNEDALVDADLKRLRFVRSHAVVADKDSLYEDALRQLAANYPNSEITADVIYELAMYHSSLGGNYVAGKGDRNRLAYMRAVEFCNLAITKYPDSQGARNCNALLLNIQTKSIVVTNEETAIPTKASRALITWRNLNKVYFRIYKTSEDLPERYDSRTEEQRMKDFLSSKLITSWENSLPDEKDYNSHAAEVKIPELPAGHYVILASAEKDFPLTDNGIAYSYIWSSSISYVERGIEDNTHEYYIFDRSSGAPLVGVSAQAWIYKYDYSDRGYHYRRGEKFTSDSEGRIIVPPTSDYREIVMEFNHKENHLYSKNFYQSRPYKGQVYKSNRTFFFTDRAIYRPGQTVYFKGIVIQTEGDKNEIVKNKNTAVTFYDANYQKVKTLDLVTNEYGSVQGSFIAPAAGLTGQMHIGNEWGNSWFSVEEYKRPKFEVNMLPVKGAYRINDSIKVSGIAKMFSGAVVDGAQVKYRVVRTASFPWWWFCWRGYYPQSSSVEIANGTVTSNDTGAFFIPFKALPDRSVSSESKPTFNYQVYADVTDITGETHSTSAYVSVGYVALNLTIPVNELLDKADTNSIPVYLNNLSGQPDSGIVSYSIYKLKSPDRILRDRTWSKPDKFLYTKEEWLKWFPEDVYDNETEMSKWEKGNSVFTGNVNTAKQKKIYLKKSGWQTGVYMLEASTKDKYGQEVKDLRYFTLYDTKDKKPANNNVWSFQAIKSSAEPGEKAVFLIGTAAKNVQILYEIEQNRKVIEKKYLKLSEEQQYIEIPITEKHRGNIAIHFAFVYHNQAYTTDQIIYVAWQSKNLDISFETFRDKLIPGQPEEWKLKIKGPKGEKVAAEMVAAMYDASLDEFRPNYWSFGIYKSYYGSLYWQHGVEGITNSSLYDKDWNDYSSTDFRDYDRFNWFGFHYGYRYNYGYYGGGDYEDISVLESREESNAPAPDQLKSSITRTKNVSANAGVVATGSATYQWSDDSDKVSEKKDANQQAITLSEVSAGEAGQDSDGKSVSEVKARSNLNETVFFFPQLETDSTGAVIIKFTMNEALTRWKFTAFAHTKDLLFGQISREVVTQKDLMIQPNAPRFLRENDQITFTAKVSNLTDKELTGTAQLLLFDALTMKPIESQLLITPAQVSFTAKKGQSAPLSWDLKIPEGMGAVLYRVVAKAGNFTDGEESALPVLSNRMLVTETMPLPIRGGQTKEFRFEKLINQSNGSTTLRNHKLTLEFTANPAWYAVQALPYMMEYPYECSEQTFSRLYANSIATHVANSSPKIKAVFDTWKSQSPDAFLSNLEKNQELKNVILTETPWVLEAKDESERKRRVGLLFDLNRMGNEEDRSMRKLRQMQVSNGGWPWFEGMPDDRWITQYIVTGFGHLDHLGVKSVRDNGRNWEMVTNGVRYLDDRMREDYEWILKYDKINMDKDHLNNTQIQYLYARSYFKDIELSSRNKEAYNYFFGQAKKYWVNKGRYMEGMLALSLFRAKEKVIADQIMKSLGETALHSEELGMYWKENSGGWYWYQAPIETQSLLIEAFKEVKSDQKSVDDLRVWLLKNKQTNDWKTTTATANACYALLLDGTSWLATESGVSIVVGTQTIDPKAMDIQTEAGTGYFKTSWSGTEIKPEMGKITVSKTDAGVSWGAVYWQYFEQLDKITPAQSPLQVIKKLFRVKNTSSGPVIEPITDQTVLKPGDKIRVRVELRNDRDMEYIHMKDMRASGFEPVNVISQYKYQDGLGYYESTKDASTDFFFSFLPKGTHVFEYPLTVIHAGDFSCGITQVQCMYAPEFAAHSEGLRVKVTK